MTRSRKVLFGACILALAAAGTAFAGGQAQSQSASTSTSTPAISILINSSPWLGSFKALVSNYEKATGNKVNLDVTPFPAMLKKARNATTAQTSEFDLVNLTEGWAVQFYKGGLVTPIKQVDPGFRLSPKVIEYDYADRWNPTTGASTKSGGLYGLPINGNIQLLFYRKDLFAQKGLNPPKTFKGLLADAKALANPPKLYGFTARTSDDPIYNYQAFLHGWGGSIVKLDPSTGKWSVNLDKKPALDALKFWLDLAWNFDPSNYTQVSQATMISLMASGRSAMAIMVDAAVSNFNNPNSSSVVGKVGAVETPGLTASMRAPTSGIWVMSIPHNLPMARKKAAFEFLTWATGKKAEQGYAEANGIPVREDVYQWMAKQAKFWWAQAAANSSPNLHHFPRVTVDGQMKFMLDDVLRQIVAKQIAPDVAMKQASQKVYSMMKQAGYQMEPLAN